MRTYQYDGFKGIFKNIHVDGQQEYDRYVTHSHKTQDRSVIKKNELFMCFCRSISNVYFDEKLNSLRQIQKYIAVLVYGSDSTADM